MSKVQLSQVGAVWAAAPSPEPITRGGTWSTGRTFNAAAVTTPAAGSGEAAALELPETPSPERIETALRNATDSITEHGATPEQAAAMTEISRILDEADDPAALAGRVLARIAAEKAQQRCPVHPWCIETGLHEWHSGAPVQVAQDCDFAESRKHDHASDPYIDAKLVSEDDRETGQRGAGAAIAFGECEVTADGMRAEVAKIRAALPRMEDLADALDGKPSYVPPTGWDDAEAIKTASARGTILKVCLFTPREDDGTPAGPQRLAVYSEGFADDELDLDGAIDFRNQLAALLPKLDAMISVLATEVPTAPPEGENAQPTGTTCGGAQ